MKKALFMWVIVETKSRLYPKGPIHPGFDMKSVSPMNNVCELCERCRIMVGSIPGCSVVLSVVAFSPHKLARSETHSDTLRNTLFLRFNSGGYIPKHPTTPSF